MRKLNISKPISVISEELMDYIVQGNVNRVFHEIEFMEMVRTDSGPATVVHLTSQTQFAPNVDVACLIRIMPRFVEGMFATETALNDELRLVSTGLELWYWRDKFWVKGVDKLGVDYYSKAREKRCYALYEIEVCNSDQLLRKLAI
jgi:hypothetical protein